MFKIDGRILPLGIVEACLATDCAFGICPVTQPPTYLKNFRLTPFKLMFCTSALLDHRAQILPLCHALDEVV